MKKFLHHSKKSNKQKDKAPTNRELHENSERRFADEDIEADNVSEATITSVKPLPFRDKGHQNGIVHASEKGSISSVQNGAVHSLEKSSTLTLQNGAVHSSEKSSYSTLQNGAVHRPEKSSTLTLQNSAVHSSEKSSYLTLQNGAVHSSEKGSTSSLQNGAVHSLGKGSTSSLQNGTVDPANIHETMLRRLRGERDHTANRDSGISSISDISAVSDISATSNNSGTSNNSATTNILATTNISSEETVDTLLQSDLHSKYGSCLKNPNHEQFIPIFSLDSNRMPECFQKPEWVRLIKLKGVDVVRLTVAQTSNDRPDELGFRGTTTVRFGTGTAFVHNMDKIELCDCGVGAPGHRCSGAFLVMTASHVVFDDCEAKTTSVDFFYDSMDVSTIVNARGVRVVSSDVAGNRSIIECRTHDLNLCQRLKSAQKERNELIEKELEPAIGSSKIAVLISHPHGLSKQVSFGNLKERKLVSEVKTTKEGIQLADCLLTYDTPTCPGAGGGPVNVIGGGTVSYAFAPHCASKSTGENLSGLGWARVI